MGRFTENDMRVMGEKINEVYYHESTSRARDMADEVYAEIAMEKDPETRENLEYRFRSVTGMSKR